MSTPITFYYACVSPWSYLGLDALKEIADRHGREIDFRPTDVARTWSETGAGQPLGNRPEVLQSYRLLELPRWGAWRGVPINKEPKHFPVPYHLSTNAIIAATQNGAAPYEVTRALMRGCWVEERDISDEGDVADILNGLGLDGAEIVGRAGSDEVAKELAANTDAALADKAWSVPSYVVDGELFFGQDRLEMIDWRLSGN
ncbi:MAG: 2-hydroxychromene-2-carboxylate isomerase [Alphaproteobacteria bacterium]|nr:2-hydroxychromene-2-carboxylate isomerase [Alphaproteobacteria bacterium]